MAVALVNAPASIPGPSDDGTFKIKSNCSCNSTILSVITGTLTLATVFPLANVVVSTVLLKSTPPDNQIFLLTHYAISHSKKTLTVKSLADKDGGSLVEKLWQIEVHFQILHAN